MSKAAESLQRRFGQNLSESLGVRAGAGSRGIGPRRPARFPGKPAPTTAGPAPGTPGHMEIDRIVPDPDQPRKEFSDDAIERLAASLLKHGQLMPIRVRWNADDRQVGRHLRRAPLPGGDPGRAQDGRLRLRRRRPEPLGDPPGTDHREPAPRGPQADRAGPGLPPAHGPPRLDRQGTLRRAARQPGGDQQVALAPDPARPSSRSRSTTGRSRRPPPTRSPRSRTATSSARSPGGSSTRT